jgi:hypothetical protein
MYMIYQQYTTAVIEAYRGHPENFLHAEKARICREWLESLDIKPDLRDPLVEQIRALENAFEDLSRN